MQPNMSGVINNFGIDITRLRYPNATFINGRMQPLVPTESTIKAVVQPTGGNDLMLMPDANRYKDTITLWTTADLQAADEATGAMADEIEFNNYRYKIITLFKRGINGFNKALAQLVGNAN